MSQVCEAIVAQFSGPNIYESSFSAKQYVKINCINYLCSFPVNFIFFDQIFDDSYNNVMTEHWHAVWMIGF